VIGVVVVCSIAFAAQKDAAKRPDRFLGYLHEGAHVELDPLGNPPNVYSIQLVGDEEVANRQKRVAEYRARLTETATQLRDIKETEQGGEKQRKLLELQRQLQNAAAVHTPVYRIAATGEDFVELHGAINPPGHEDVSWMVLPLSVIRYIKGESTRSP
jgi:hypothetical protein